MNNQTYLITGIQGNVKLEPKSFTSKYEAKQYILESIVIELAANHTYEMINDNVPDTTEDIIQWGIDNGYCTKSPDKISYLGEEELTFYIQQVELYKNHEEALLDKKKSQIFVALASYPGNIHDLAAKLGAAVFDMDTLVFYDKTEHEVFQLLSNEGVIYNSGHTYEDAWSFLKELEKDYTESYQFSL